MNTEIKSCRNELKAKLILFKAYSSRGVIDALYLWDGVSDIREKFVYFVTRVTFGEFDESKIMSEEKLKDFLDRNCDQDGYDTKPFVGISPDFEFSVTLGAYKDDLIFI